MRLRTPILLFTLVLLAAPLPGGNAYATSASIQKRLEMRKAKKQPASSSSSAPTTRVMSSSRSSQASQATSNIVNVGVTVTVGYDQIHLINELVPGSPAEKAGLHIFDEILSINGNDLKHNQTGKDIENLLNGPEGTSVKVEYGRVNLGIHETTIVRTKTTANAEAADYAISYVQPDIAMIKVSALHAYTIAHIRTDCAAIQAKNPRAVILDLRSNPDGDIDAVKKLLSCFLPNGTEFLRTFKNVEVIRGDYGSFSTADTAIFTSATKIGVLIKTESGPATSVVSLALKSFAQSKTVLQTVYSYNYSISVHTFFPSSYDIGNVDHMMVQDDTVYRYEWGQNQNEAVVQETANSDAALERLLQMLF